MGAYEFLPAAALPGLTDWYRAEGNADDGVGGNPGTLVGPVSFAPGKVGQAFSFNGGSYVSVPDSPSLSFTSAVTLDAWVNPATLNFSGGFGTVVAKSNYLAARNYGLWVTSSGSVQLSYFNSSGANVYIENTVPGLVSPGVWTNVAGVIDTVHGVMQVYVNGQLVASQATSGPMVADNVPLTIGADDGGTYFFNGLIDEVQVYNRALAPADVLKLAGTTTVAPGQVSIVLDPASDSESTKTGHLTNVTTPTFDVTVNNPGSIELDVDGTPVTTQPVAAAGIVPITLTAALADGQHTIKAIFTPSTGTAVQASITVTIDTTPPQITSATPSGNVSEIVDHVDATLSEPINVSTFTASALTLTGPGGTITVGTPSLVSGNTYRIPFAPQSAIGTYTLVVAPQVADLAGNTLSSSFSDTFTIQLPDLVADSISASDSTFGATIPVTYTLHNAGNLAAAAPWVDQIYLSASATLDTNAILLATVPHTASLAAGSQFSGQTTVTLPLRQGLAPGTYHLFVVADGTNQVVEANESNNTASTTITLAYPPLPDLATSHIAAPAEGWSGRAITVSWTVANQGSAATQGTWTDDVYLSSDGTTNSEVLLGQLDSPENLAPGQSYQRSQDFTLPNGISGNYWIIVTANANNSFFELNTNNNTSISQPFPVHLTHMPICR